MARHKDHLSVVSAVGGGLKKLFNRNSLLCGRKANLLSLRTPFLAKCTLGPHDPVLWFGFVG